MGLQGTVGTTHAWRTQSDGSVRAHSEGRYKGIEEKKKMANLWRGRTPSRKWKWPMAEKIL